MGEGRNCKIPDKPLFIVRAFNLAIYHIVARYHETQGLVVVPFKGPQGDWCWAFTLESILRKDWRLAPDERRVKNPELLCSQRGFIYKKDGTHLFPKFEPSGARTADYERWLLDKLDFKRFFTKHDQEIDNWLHPSSPRTKNEGYARALDEYESKRAKELGRRGYIGQLQAILALAKPVETAKKGPDPIDYLGCWKTNEFLYWNPWQCEIFAPKAERLYYTGHLPWKATLYLAKRIFKGETDPLKWERGWVSIFGNQDGVEGWSISLNRLTDGRYILVQGSKGTINSPFDDDITFLGTAREMREHIKRFHSGYAQRDILRKIV